MLGGGPGGKILGGGGGGGSPSKSLFVEIFPDCSSSKAFPPRSTELLSAEVRVDESPESLFEGVAENIALLAAGFVLKGELKLVN